MGIINSLYESDYTSRACDRYDRCTNSGRWLPHMGYSGSQRSSEYFYSSSHMAGDQSYNALMAQHNYKDLESQLSYKRRIVSEHLMEREKLYKEEMRKRDECYARHKRRSKKRFSLYSILYR
uniref:P13 n=1 Tax=Olivavirus actinidiae TaxID=2024724 RepID=A0A7L9CEK2_9CLOS|nr:P13 [Actinidia virus 1]